MKDSAPPEALPQEYRQLLGRRLEPLNTEEFLAIAYPSAADFYRLEVQED